MHHPSVSCYFKRGVFLCSALALAPFVDRGLSWFTVKFKFQSQGKASEKKFEVFLLNTVQLCASQLFLAVSRLSRQLLDFALDWLWYYSLL